MNISIFSVWVNWYWYPFSIYYLHSHSLVQNFGVTSTITLVVDRGEYDRIVKWSKDQQSHGTGQGKFTVNARSVLVELEKIK